MSQTAKLKELLLDTEPHNTLEIRQVVYGNEILNMARIAARVNDLKKEGYVIKGFKKDGKYWYQMQTAKTFEFKESKPIYNFNGELITKRAKQNENIFA